MKVAVNTILFLAGCVLTKLAVDYAYLERGYKAYGSEWLVLPMFLIATWLIRKAVRKMIRPEE